MIKLGGIEKYKCPPVLVSGLLLSTVLLDLLPVLETTGRKL